MGIISDCRGYSSRSGTIFVLVMSFGISLLAQDTGKTVRHHKVADDNPFPQQLAQAEAAIEKKDYASAEPLLNTVVTSDPNNYQAWFDLGLFTTL